VVVGSELSLPVFLEVVLVGERGDALSIFTSRLPCAFQMLILEEIVRIYVRSRKAIQKESA
jgi:hypothetical protein